LYYLYLDIYIEKLINFFENYSKKICDFLQVYYCILINIGLYFYTVKIQIRYSNTRFTSKTSKIFKRIFFLLKKKEGFLKYLQKYC